MIIIDGSEGEGGGQIVRNACALSLVTGEPFRITNIRGGRAKPGLMRQHVTAIEAACAIGGGVCEGANVGSREMSFVPGKVQGGDYHFAVGTAGSTGLVLQTILMPLVLADAPSRIILEGGTHNVFAPPFDFIERCFLPIVNRMGPRVSARLVRHGFYPRGGGRIEVEIEPASLVPVECVERGAMLSCSATAFFAGLPFDVADREIRMAKKQLDWPERAFSVRELPEEQGPGNILLLEAVYEQATEIVSGFGKLGVPAEQLAKRAAARMQGYLDSTAFAGPYLADQLLLPFAIAGGGVFTTVKPSQHLLTAIDVIGRFLNRKTAISQEAGGTHRVVVG